MKNSDRICLNCAYFNAYYRAGFCEFWRERDGVCSVSGNAANEDFTCDKWKRTPKKYASLRDIDGAIADTQYLTDYFESCE